MTKIKICGIKEKEDLEFIIKFPVSYVGFIMYPKSPRYAGEKLKELLSVETKPKKVVVFVDPSFEEVKRVLDMGADLIQLHGKESLNFANKIGLHRVIKVFKVKNEAFRLEELKTWKNAYAILLDTFVKGIPGGTGKTFNWDLAKKAVLQGYRIFLAGGINPENALDAIKKVNPYAIDLASGVEASPGKKDQNKIKKLFSLLKF